MQNWPVFRHVSKTLKKKTAGRTADLTATLSVSRNRALLYHGEHPYLCFYASRSREMHVTRHTRDKTLPWVDPLPLPARDMNKQETNTDYTERRKNESHQSPFLFSQKCLKIYGMSKENLNVDQSANCRLRRAIRLLVQCETALETNEAGLQIALPGTKFQYYRPVFKDFEDILQRLKTRLVVESLRITLDYI